MLLTLFFFTILFAVIITKILEKKFLKYSLFIDKPSSRSMHLNPIPTAGGISILISYSLYLFFLNNIFNINNTLLILLFVSLLPIVIVSIMDDFKEINVFVRLLVQFFSAALLIYYF